MGRTEAVEPCSACATCPPRRDLGTDLLDEPVPSQPPHRRLEHLAIHRHAEDLFEAGANLLLADSAATALLSKAVGNEREDLREHLDGEMRNPIIPDPLSTRMVRSQTREGAAGDNDSLNDDFVSLGLLLKTRLTAEVEIPCLVAPFPCCLEATLVGVSDVEAKRHVARPRLRLGPSRIQRTVPVDKSNAAMEGVVGVVQRLDRIA